jgi:threonine/homoserine/homoserine lactone efflux protein
VRSTILGWIGVIWGALIVSSGIRGLLAGDLGSGTYELGRMIAILCGALLLYAGIRALRSPRTASPGFSS